MLKRLRDAITDVPDRVGQVANLLVVDTVAVDVPVVAVADVKAHVQTHVMLVLGINGRK